MLTPLECSLIQDDDYRKEHGYPDWTTLETDKYDTQFFIKKRTNGEVVICFCPSNSKTDWMNNFHFWKKAYHDADIKFYVHSGFLRCWKEVRHYIEDEVARLQPKCITVTGWSYGGALSDLCTEDMAYLYPNMIIHNITFGGPRVVWGYFHWKTLKTRWNNEYVKSIKFKNGSDVVTAVPLIGMGFHHVGELTHIGKPIRWWRYFFPYEYHIISAYTEVIKRISGEE